MESLIISLLVALLGIMQNPQVPVDQRVQIYQKTMPVISKYMEETKPVGEISTGASTEDMNIEVEEGIKVGGIIISKPLNIKK